MSFGWLALAVIYILLLFWIAKWGDKNTPTARWLTSHPMVYSLALGIYCTAWTFFGAVGQASRGVWMYLPILIGPIIVYLFFHRFLHKLILVSKKQHISTIADFISARYGKRQMIALLVTAIALMATIPYIALQLKAIGAIFSLISDEQHIQWVVITATLLIAIFAMYFGTQNTDVTEYRRGLMLAISFESCIKVLALILVAIVGYSMWEALSEPPLLTKFMNTESFTTFGSFSFWAQTLMAAAAVICLPRQFHVAVIDNINLQHLKLARWVFPLYLFVIGMTIPVIAVAGDAIFRQGGAEPDNYVLALAILSESVILQVVVFLGGLSAATAMIIVATLTLSTMLTNDVILPKLIAERSSITDNKIRRIKRIRRLLILAILALAFVYQQQMTYQASLASIGLLAFSLVIHLLPAIVGGLYWKKGHAHGVYAGLLAGLVVWVMWLMLPVLSGETSNSTSIDPVSLGAMLSLLANIVCYISFSWFTHSRLIDRIQAEAFVSPSDVNAGNIKSQPLSVTVDDLYTLITKFTGEHRCKQLFQDYENRSGAAVKLEDSASESFVAFCERALGGVVGSSSAKALIDSLVKGKKMDITEVVNFFDDTAQGVQFNISALTSSLENLDQGISVIDKNLKLVAWNKRYLDLFDFPSGMVAVGTPIEDLIRFNAMRGNCGPGEADLQVKRRLEHLKQGSSHRYTRQREDGKVIEMVGNALPGGGFVTSFHDITEHIEIQQALEESNVDLEQRIRKRTEEVHSINAELRLEIERRNVAEKELIRARQQAEDANASKTRFLALASHDVLQPLNAAKLYISALNEEALDPDTKDIVTKLKDSVLSSEAIISTILDISRLDQGELKPYIESISVLETLTPVINEMSMKAERKGLSFKSRVQDLWVFADKTYLYRIVQNLVSNAVKYTSSGKVLLTVRKQGDKVLIQVWDTGIGIPEAQQKDIFSDFYRVENSNEQGIGLGLGVVKRLTQKIACSIDVRSTEHKGSCFSLYLDWCSPPIQPKVLVSNTSSLFSGLRVLCIDDQEENLDAMLTLLSKWGIEVAIAADFDSAREQARIHEPQILLVDYQLGKGPNGLQIIESLRQERNTILPACLITAKRGDDLSASCREQGVNFMSKPIKPAKLRSLLQSMTKYIKSANVESQ